MLHTISKQNEHGHVELTVSRSVSEEKTVLISVLQFNHENLLIDDNNIQFNEKEFYDFIGTLLFVQSQLKK